MTHVSALDQILEGHVQNQAELSITLRDGSTRQGRVKDFDSYVIVLADGPGTMLYRHSILKLSEAVPTAPEKQPKPAAPPATLPKVPMAAPKVQARKKVEKPRTESPAPKKTPKAPESGELGPMGEGLMKWLKNQKGRE